MQQLSIILLFTVFSISSSFYSGKTLACRDMEKHPFRSARYCNISCRARGRISGECLWLEKEGVNKTIQKIASCNCTEEKITTTPRTKATKFATTIKSEETTSAGSSEVNTTTSKIAENTSQPVGTATETKKPTEPTKKVDSTNTSTSNNLDTKKPNSELKKIDPKVLP